MPKYKIGDKILRRKNLYMPCILNEKFLELPEEKQAKLLKETYWADNITEKEWEFILGRTLSYEGVVKSRLKRKAVGWFMALSRIAYLNPTFYNKIVKQAEKNYEAQIGEPSPILKGGERK